MSRLIDIDAKLLVKTQQTFKNKYLDKFFTIYTHTGDLGAIWGVVGLVLFVIQETRETAVVMMLSLVATWLFNTVFLKRFLKRTRPYEMVEGVRLLINPQRDTSFPSGHAASSLACAVVIIVMYGGALGWLALGAALLMAFSRVYVGVHYPLDVLVGSIVGTLVAFLVVWVYSSV